MQAVICWTLGTSWPHSRRASPVHICCASDEKARPGRAESAAPRRRREVRFCRKDGKSSMHSPRLRAVLAAVRRGRCTRFALPHASSITRETPGVVARFLPMSELKVLRRPVVNYALMFGSCNGSRQHFPGLLRARHVDRSVDARQLGFDFGGGLLPAPQCPARPLPLRSIARLP